jgi:WD40 repeat protein
MAWYVQADGTTEQPSGPAGANESQPPLPARALSRIGMDDLRTRNSFITDIAFSPDGRFIAAAEANAPVPRVSLFDARTGRLSNWISPPDRPRGWVQCVAFSPDGRILATGGEDGVVRLLRAEDPRATVQTLATGEQKPVRRGFTGLPAGGLPVDPLHLAFTPDEARLIVGSGSSGTISVWRIKDGRLERRIEQAHGNSRGPNPSLSSIAVTPDGRLMLSTGQSTVPITQTKLKFGPRNVTLTEVRLWDLETGNRVKDLQVKDNPGRGYAALSRDGRLVAVGDFGLLRIIDAATGKTERMISLPGSWGHQPAFSPDETIVAMAIQNGLGIFDVQTGRRWHHDERTPEGELKSAAWSATGGRIVTGHGDGKIRVGEATTGKLLWQKPLAPAIGLHGSNAGPAFVAFSEDGRRVVKAGRRDDPLTYDGGIVAVYDAATGTLEREVDCQAI